MHLLFAGIACKIYFLMPSNFDEKMPLDYDKFCPLKMMAFMVIKGNIICWHFLKALPSANTTPLYSEGNNSIFLRQSFFPYNLRAFHTTVYFIHFNEYLLLSVTIDYYLLLSATIGYYRLLSAAIGKIARAFVI